MKEVFIVGIGGFVGASLRYGISKVAFHGEYLLLNTVLVNLIGCFLIGLLWGLVPKMNHQLSLLLIPGFCGGFTTFSAFSKDSIVLFHKQQFGFLASYISINVVLGIAVCLLGLFITKKML